MKRILGFVALASTLGMLPSQAATYTYNLDPLSLAGGTLAGYITTDTNVGSIDYANVTAYYFTITGGPYAGTYGQSPAYASQFHGSPITASATNLSVSGDGVSGGPGTLTFDYAVSSCSIYCSIRIWSDEIDLLDYFNLPLGFASISGNFADIQQTPLPAALSLFTTGLGALGLLSWRRKKKSALAA